MSAMTYDSEDMDDSDRLLRKRYNKLVVIDLKKRAALRNLVKQYTQCEHKQIYTQANAICRRISTSVEEAKISLSQGAKLMIDAHNQMTHMSLPKDVVAAEMNKRLDKLENKNNYTKSNSKQEQLDPEIGTVARSDNDFEKDDDEIDKYSENYWREIF